MLFLNGQTTIKNSIGQPGGIASLDLSGKVELTQAPPALINSFFESAETSPANIQAVLTAMITAYKGDIVSFSVLGQSYMLGSNPYSTWANWKELKTTAASLNGKTEAQLRDTFIPVGMVYVETPGGKLPSDILKTQSGTDCIFPDLNFGSLALFNAAKAICMYPGTTWKLAIRAADTIRQAGSRIDTNGNTIGSAFGVLQEHQMQGHKSETPLIYGASVFGYSANVITGGTAYSNQAANATLTGNPYNDGVNGTPLTGTETRMANTAVRFWVRVA